MLFIFSTEVILSKCMFSVIDSFYVWTNKDERASTITHEIIKKKYGNYVPRLKEVAHAKTFNLGCNVVYRSKLTFPISFKQSTLFSIPI